MLKMFALLFLASGVLSACTLPWQQQFSGLTVQASEGATFQVYLDDLHLGQAPIERSDIKPGTYKIKLDPGDGTKMYEGQIRLHPGTVSSVLWSFAGTQSSGTGEILELEPLPTKSRAELSVVSVPEGSTVQLNNTTYGLSPVILDEAEPGQYSLSLNAVGHVKKTITVQITSGFRLNVFSRLERASDSLETSTPPSVAATASAAVSPLDASTQSPTTTTPTPAPSSTPPTTPSTASGSATTITPPYLTVKETGTGWLRVRAAASATGEELTRVNVGTRHKVRGIQSGWYEIEYEPAKFGWVSGQYIEYVAQ